MYDEDIEKQAFIEYLEQGEIDYLDLKTNLNEVVSRTGVYVCFCKK